MKLGTEIVEGTRISLEAIRANVMRSVLTTIGIVIGVVTVTLMATAIRALDRAFVDAVSFIGTDVLYIDQREWFSSSEQRFDAAGRRNKITLAQARSLERQLDNVRAVAPTVMHGVDSVRYDERSSSSVFMIGTTEQFLITGGVTLASGRFMTRTEAYANRDVCIIGAEIAQNLFLNQSPLGKMIRVGNESLEVIGTLEKRGSIFGQISLDNQIILPIGKLVNSYRRDPNCVIQVKVGDPERIEVTKDEVRGLMRKIRKVPPGKNDDFAINRQEQLLAQFGKVSGVIATSGFFITGLSLFVGGIGIMNIMFVSVAERTQEIGIRKAIGARRRTILLQFLIEAAAICLLGGLIALGIAGGIVGVASRFLPQVALSWGIVLLAVSVALVTGLISGFLPAWRAANMKPVDALRND